MGAYGSLLNSNKHVKKTVSWYLAILLFSQCFNSVTSIKFQWCFEVPGHVVKKENKRNTESDILNLS